MRQLDIVLAVCQSESYSRAAEQLALTQPAVSSQIRQVERLIGEPLFHYSGKQLHITPAGKLLERTARDIRQRLVTTEMELAEQGGNIKGTLYIAAESSAQYFIPAVIAEFREAYPEVAVDLAIGNRGDILKALFDSKVDLAIAGSPPSDRSVDFTPFRDNDIVAVANPGHTLLDRRHISLLELNQETLLTRESGSGTRLILEDLAREQSVKLNNACALGSLEAIKTAVKCRAGVALLPLDCCRDEIKNNKLAVLPMRNFPLKRSWCTMKIRNRQLTPVPQRFLEHLLTTRSQ